MKKEIFGNGRRMRTGPAMSRKTMLKAAAFLALAVTLQFGIGCSKSKWGPGEGNPSDELHLEEDTTLLPETVMELKEAKSAAGKYHNINAALSDGYADIDVVRQNMGYHFLKSTLLDGNFDPARPEILVYNKTHEGEQQLVALEYAVPIETTPNKAPHGFTGSADVWAKDTTFGLWLLHAWVFAYNPQGVFNPTNPLVHLH